MRPAGRGLVGVDRLGKRCTLAIDQGVGAPYVHVRMSPEPAPAVGGSFGDVDRLRKRGALAVEQGPSGAHRRGCRRRSVALPARVISGGERGGLLTGVGVGVGMVSGDRVKGVLIAVVGWLVRLLMGN